MPATHQHSECVISLAGGFVVIDSHTVDRTGRDIVTEVLPILSMYDEDGDECEAADECTAIVVGPDSAGDFLTIAVYQGEPPRPQ